jgi:hypothetical protein
VHITYSIQLRAIALLFLFVTCFPVLLLLQLIPAESVNVQYFYAFVLLCSLVFLLLSFGLMLNKVRSRGQQLQVRSGFFNCNIPMSDVQRVEHLSWAEWLCSQSQPMQRRRGMEFLDCQTGWFEQADGRMAFLMVFADDVDITVLHGAQFDLVLSGHHQLTRVPARLHTQNA